MTNIVNLIAILMGVFYALASLVLTASHGVRVVGGWLYVPIYYVLLFQFGALNKTNQMPVGVIVVLSVLGYGVSILASWSITGGVEAERDLRERRKAEKIRHAEEEARAERQAQLDEERRIREEADEAERSRMEMYNRLWDIGQCWALSTTAIVRCQLEDPRRMYLDPDGYQEVSVALGLNFDQHAIIVGRDEASHVLNSMICRMAQLYSPDELEFILLDSGLGANFLSYDGLPHAHTLVADTDPDVILNLLRGMRDHVTSRQATMKAARTPGYRAYRESGGEMPRMLLVINQWQDLVDEPSDVAREILKCIDHIARQGDSVGVHLVLSCATVPRSASELLLERIAVRVILPCLKVDFVKLTDSAWSEYQERMTEEMLVCTTASTRYMITEFVGNQYKGTGLIAFVSAMAARSHKRKSAPTIVLTGRN